MLSQPTLAQRLLPRQGVLERPLVRDGLLVLAGTVLMALCAQISITLPGTLVPFTMQTFGVLLIGALYGPRLGALTLAAYLLEGLAGLPVFAMGTNAWSPSLFPGLPVILGPTAGYLFAFPLAAALVGALATRGWDRRVASALPAMLLGSLVILLCGFAWMLAAVALVRGSFDPSGSFVRAVWPFLPGDTFKILLAALALPGGWALLGTRRDDAETRR